MEFDDFRVLDVLGVPDGIECVVCVTFSHAVWAIAAGFFFWVVFLVLNVLDVLGGVERVCLGRYIRFLTNLEARFRADGIQVHSLPRKQGLSGLSAGSRQSPGPRQSGASAAAPNRTSLAPGARMT